MSSPVRPQREHTPAGRVAQRVGGVRDALGRRRRAGGVQHQRDLVRVARHARVIELARLVHVRGHDGQQRQAIARHLAALGDLLLATEGHDRPRARLLGQRRHLRLVEHRRQRGEHDAAVQAPEHRDRGLDRVAAEQDHDLPRPDARVRQPVRDGDRRAAQLCIRHRAVLEDQGDARSVLARTRIEVAPQITVLPVALRVVALGLRLELESRHGHCLTGSSMLISGRW